MHLFYPSRTTSRYQLLCCYLLLALVGHAQAPAWAEAIPGSLTQTNGGSWTSAVAADAHGNVFVTGGFSGEVLFGNTLLTSVGGSTDLFVAKYVLASGTWAWAQSGGGISYDGGQGIAVSGSSVYVTGFSVNDASNGNRVVFGGTGTTPGTVPVNGASPSSSTDLILLKYTDNGSSATLGWTQVGGGAGGDLGQGVAVSGSSVYVTGIIQNDLYNINKVVFGGTGTKAGTVQVNGVSANSDDLFLAKYTDNGSSATLGWTQVGGGARSDGGFGVAVSGSSVYVTGGIVNSASNGNGVLFGGTGTTPGTVPVNGVTNQSGNYQFPDLVLAKYTDNGSSATLGWTQVGGGRGSDQGNGVAVSGSSVYVTGYISN